MAKKIKKGKGKTCIYCIVKRKGHTEEFDERKVYASCYAACLNAQIGHKNAEKISEKVSKELKAWVTNKREISSDGIFKKVVVSMGKYDKDAAFMYETHRDIA